MRLYSPEPSSGACPKADQQQHLPKPKKIPSYFSVCISYFLTSFFSSLFAWFTIEVHFYYRQQLVIRYLPFVTFFQISHLYSEVRKRCHLPASLGLPRPNGLIIYGSFNPQLLCPFGRSRSKAAVPCPQYSPNDPGSSGFFPLFSGILCCPRLGRSDLTLRNYGRYLRFLKTIYTRVRRYIKIKINRYEIEIAA